MKNSAYWQERFILLQKRLQKKEADYMAALEKQYKLAMSSIEKDISVWYQRFADNNSISMAEARRLLKGNELRELRWSVAEYIKYGEENALHQAWLKELENASAKVHISRLEALQLHLQQQVEVIVWESVG